MSRNTIKKEATDKPQATTGPSGSWLSLFNPLSSLSDTAIDKYPAFAAELAPGNAKSAYFASKLGAMLLLGAALGGGAALFTRALNKTRKQLEYDKQLGAPRYMGLGSETAGLAKSATAQGKRPGDVGELGTVDKSVLLALSASALLAGGAAAHKAFGHAGKSEDKAEQRMRNDVSNQELLEIAKLRAANARGQLGYDERQELKSKLISRGFVPAAYATLGKSASLHKKAELQWKDVFFGPLALGILGAAGGSWLLSHRYLSKQDKDNIAYERYKQELERYARERVEREPLELRTSLLLASALKENGQPQAVRDLPETTEPNKPLALSL